MSLAVTVTKLLLTPPKTQEEFDLAFQKMMPEIKEVVTEMSKEKVASLLLRIKELSTIMEERINAG